MPPKSRKRNKGKERKAKKEVIKAQKEREQSYMLWRRLLVGISPGLIAHEYCHHGLCGQAFQQNSPLLPDDHPVSIFMDDLFMSLGKKDSMEGMVTLNNAYRTHPEVLSDDSNRELAIDILICVGTNLLIDGATHNASRIAQSIVVLEHYNGTDDVDLVLNKRVVVSKWRDLSLSGSSSRRDALKFYRKRTSCKCLKKMHLEARKSTPKMGNCCGCGKEIERMLLSVCSRCTVVHYCTRECQVADLPGHRKECDALSLHAVDRSLKH